MAIHRPGFPGGGSHILRKTAIAFGANGPAFEWPVVDVAAQHIPHQYSLADPVRGNILTNGSDMATDIRTLDTGKFERRTRPAAVFIAGVFKTRRAPGIGLPGYILRVPGDTGIDIGIVDTGGSNLYQNLAVAGSWHWHILAIFQFFKAAMPGEQDSVHGIGYVHGYVCEYVCGVAVSG